MTTHTEATGVKGFLSSLTHKRTLPLGLHWLISFVFCSFMALIVLLGALFLWAGFGPAGQRIAAYRRVSPGTAYAQVLEEFGGAPDAVTAYRCCRVAVYFGHKLRSGEPVALPETLASLQDLPNVYDSMQFLVSREGIVVAKVWCGEGVWVETLSEKYQADSLASLEKRLPEELKNACGCGEQTKQVGTSPDGP